MEKQSKNLNRDILVLQAIGIILVVAGHCHNGFLNFDLLLPYYNFHMPLFVFISGYFFNNDKFIGKWLLHKIKKLLVPYFLINAIFCLLANFLCRFYPFHLATRIDAKGLILEPLHPGVLYGFNAATWFVIILFYIEVIYYILAKLLPFHKTVVIVTLISLVIGSMAIRLSINEVYVRESIENATLKSLLRVMVLMPFYGLGHVYKRFESKLVLKLDARGGEKRLFWHKQF